MSGLEVAACLGGRRAVGGGGGGQGDHGVLLETEALGLMSSQRPSCWTAMAGINPRRTLICIFNCDENGRLKAVLVGQQRDARMCH